MKQTMRLMLGLLSALSLQAAALATPVDFIVQTQPGASAAAIAKTYSIHLKDVAPGGAPFALFTADSAVMDDLENSLGADPRVAWFDLEESVGLAESDTTSRGGTIPVVGSIDHLDKENAHLLAQIHFTAAMRNRTLAAVRIAVLDTGISPKATTLWAKMIRYRNQIPAFMTTFQGIYDYPDPRFKVTAPQNQSVGHGTMVAGLIHEIAPNAQFIFERVADGTGKATSWSVIRGLADAVYAHATVVNISLGAPGPIVAFEQAFAWAASKGLIIVAPAGNNSTKGLLEPASLDGVIAVAGVDATDHKATFSDYDNKTPTCAPAVGIRSINWDGNMAIWSGTSFSSPLVAGALCYSIGTGKVVTNANAKELLKSGGDVIDKLNPLYKGMIGRRLDITKLLTTSVSGNGP